MELSRHSPAPARYTGIGLVIAIHVAAVAALSMAFIVPKAKPKEPIVLLPPTERVQEPPPPPVERVKAPQPIITTVPIQQIAAPDLPTITPDLIIYDPTATAAVPTDGPATRTVTPTLQPPPVIAKPKVQAPGAVCSTMPRPDVPVVSWAGEAVLQVVATVRGGRVVGSDFRVLQGALDAKSRRALQRSVESALAGYQCQGDATFQQDFAFRLE